MDRLLRELREAGAHEPAAALADRLPAAGLFWLLLEQHGRADQFCFGREADGSPSAPWGWEDLVLRPCSSVAVEQEEPPQRQLGVRWGTGERTRRSVAPRAARPAETSSRKTSPLNSPVTGG